MDSIHSLRTFLTVFATSLAFAVGMPCSVLAIGDSATSAEPGSLLPASPDQLEALPALMMKDALVLEEREGYNSEYIFGMTKGILNSTLHPALKPLTCLVTVPLDLVGLPFAALLGAL